MELCKSVQILAGRKRDPGYGGAPRPETCGGIFLLLLLTTPMIAGLKTTGVRGCVRQISMADANFGGGKK